MKKYTYSALEEPLGVVPLLLARVEDFLQAVFGSPGELLFQEGHNGVDDLKLIMKIK